MIKSINSILLKIINNKDKENPETLRKGKFFVSSLLLLSIFGIIFISYSFLFQPEKFKDNITAVIVISFIIMVLFIYKKIQIRVLLVNILTFLMFSLLIETYKTGGGIFSTDNIWCVVYSCWVFLVANKQSGLFWFGISLIYYVFLFIANYYGIKDFKGDAYKIESDFVFINFFFSALFLGIIIYLHEKGKEKYLKALIDAKVNIEEKNILLEKQKQDIISSIQYAKRIQFAILPSEETINQYFANAFILYKPKSILSGDFYYIKKTNELLYVAVADCTGHGVPGSLMTMLGFTFLNELINTHKLTETDQILNELREKIKIALKQTGKITEAKDGMDINLCIIDRQLNTLQFSGANCSLMCISNDALIEYKSDRMPIGIFRKEKPFSKQTIQIYNNDIFYMFSDGYITQLGGANDEMFNTKLFKEILLKIHNKLPSIQKVQLMSALSEWQGKNEQTDDILILGFRYEY